MAGGLGGSFSGRGPVLPGTLDLRAVLCPHGSPPARTTPPRPQHTHTHTLCPSRLRFGVYPAWTGPSGLLTDGLLAGRLWRHLSEPQRPPFAAQPRAGAKLGPFARAQRGSPPGGIDLGGRRPRPGEEAGVRVGEELRWREAEARPPFEPRCERWKTGMGGRRGHWRQV